MSVRFDLRAARLNKGLSQRELAKEINVDRDVIRRLEMGMGVRPASAKRVADYFDVLVMDLVASAEVPA